MRPLNLPRRIMLLEERRDWAISLGNMKRATRCTAWISHLMDELERRERAICHHLLGPATFGQQRAHA